MDAVQTRRAIGYPVVAVALGVLVWFGFLREVDPDLGTSISCAEMQIGLAAEMVRSAEDGGDVTKARAAVADMLEDAESWIDAAERVGPDEPRVAVLRGDLASVRGDLAATRRHYQRAARMPACTDEGRVLIEIRLAWMLAGGGELQSAYSELERLRKRCEAEPALSRFETEIARLEFDLRSDREDRVGAVVVANRLAARGGIDASREAGAMFESLGDAKRAEEIYAHPSMPTFLSDYCRARLKARHDEIDTALELLERALHTAREDVLAEIDRDRDDWRAWESDARFERLVVRPDEAAAKPAR